MDRAASRADSLTKRTTDTLRQMIIEGVLNLGQTLSETKVARLLGVSRTPVREAFAHLEIEGLVFSEPQRSTRVFLLGPRDVDDICDVRRGLEKMALGLAMKGDRTELFSLLSDAAARMSKAIESGDISEYLWLDRQFHQAVFDCAGNVFLNDAYQTIANKIAALRTRLATRPDYLRKGHDEHLRLCELVRAGDVQGAMSVLEEHVSRNEDSFWHLNDGLADSEVWRGKSEHRTAATTADVVTRTDRHERIFRRARSLAKRRESQPKIALSDDNSVDVLSLSERKGTVAKSINDENNVDVFPASRNYVDVITRGRPRIYANNAARKRAWAARERAKKKAEAFAAGATKKRGRPRKYTTQAERQNADEKRRR